MSLEGVQARLEEERYRGDLGVEVNKLRSLLTQEKKKMYTETTRLAETSQLFEQVYLDYVAVMEGVKTASQEKKLKSQQQAVLSDIAESNMRDNVDSMTARLMQAEQALVQERKTSQAMRERLEKAALDLEALPLLQVMLLRVRICRTWIILAGAGAGAGRGLPVGLQRGAHGQGANRRREGRPRGAAQEDRQ